MAWEVCDGVAWAGRKSEQQEILRRLQVAAGPWQEGAAAMSEGPEPRPP